MSEKYVICHLCQNQIFNEEQSKLNHLFEHHRDIARPLTLNKNRHSPDPILPTRYRTPLYVDNRLPSGWHRKVTQRQSGAYAGRYEVRIFSPTGKRFRSKNELKTFFDKTGETVLQLDHFDFTIWGTNEYADKTKSSGFYCVVCAATFYTANHFLCHFHFSVRDGECPHCFKLFNGQILKQHIKIVHGPLFNRHISKNKNLEEDCASKTLLPSTTTDIDLDKLDSLLPWLTNVAPNKNNPLRSLVSLTNDITNRNSTSEKNDGNDATGHNCPIASKRGRISKNADLKIINQKVNRTFMKRWRKKDLTDLLLEKEKERREKDNSSKLKKAQLEKQRKKLIEIQID